MLYLARLTCFATFAAFVATAQPALSETREERLAAARDYVQISMDALDMEAMVATMWAPLATEYETRHGAPLSEAQKDKLQKLYMDNLSGPLKDLMQGQDEIMADLFTLNEINALNSFYSTEEGKSVMVKLPQLMERIQPGIMQLVQGNLVNMLPEIMAILEEPPAE